MHLVPRPNGYVIFCDDIRQELGNKVSLSGVYGGEMLFPAETAFPIALPKLGVAISWSEALDCPYDELTFKLGMRRFDADIDKDDEVSFGETKLDARKAREDFHSVARPHLSKGTTSIHFMPAFVLAPFLIPFPGLLRVRLLRGDETWAVGALAIVVSAPSKEAVVKAD
jgi:hypothetical protein